MVERITQEGMIAPIPETNTRVLETTLAELGIDTYYDNLNLASDRLTLGVKKVGEDTVYVGLLKHPFAGEHFAQFLNNVAPFSDQSIDGIMADVILPIQAQADYQEGRDRTTSDYIRLHERHLNDPRVREPYIRFAEDHAGTWLEALEVTNGSQVFERLQRSRFINSTEDLRKEVFSEEGNCINPVNDIDARFFIRYELGIFKAHLFDILISVEDLLKSLTKEEQKEVAASYFANHKRQILLNLGTHRIISDKRNPDNRIGEGKVKFADNNRDVIISNGKGTKVVITPKGQNGERFSWKAIKYQFPVSYEKSSLYPIVAWKKDGNGTRTFLTQQEAMPQVAELGLEEGEQGDTKLGEIAVAYFARDTIKNWPTKRVWCNTPFSLN